MGQRQKQLAFLMKSNGFEVSYPIIINRSIFSNSIYHNEILKVYKSLGGILDDYPINIGDFDIVSTDFCIELDEENHFTRYRKITLQTDFYKQYKYFSVSEYILFCDSKEDNARSDGGYWTNDSCEKQFGKSSPANDFTGNGSARWKQRAFYDFLKDVYSVITNKPVFRFSIYDEINNFSIDEILKKQKNESELINYIKVKLRL